VEDDRTVIFMMLASIDDDVAPYVAPMKEWQTRAEQL